MILQLGSVDRNAALQSCESFTDECVGDASPGLNAVFKHRGSMLGPPSTKHAYCQTLALSFLRTTFCKLLDRPSNVRWHAGAAAPEEGDEEVKAGWSAGMIHHTPSPPSTPSPRTASAATVSTRSVREVSADALSVLCGTGRRISSPRWMSSRRPCHASMSLSLSSSSASRCSPAAQP